MKRSRDEFSFDAESSGKYSPNNPDLLWVGPEDEASGNGTFENPFGRISAALAKVLPGQTVVLKEGTYRGDATIQVSGAMDRPIRIIAVAESKAVICGGCWYFYDVCDLIVSGLTFKDSPLGAVAVMGSCERNRFDHLHFENCGHSPKASSTLFFGGSGAACNIVESCEFTHSLVEGNRRRDPDSMTVGLMISEGDTHDGKPITDHVIRRNRFSNYDYGLLVGAQDASASQYGHSIAYNSIDNCLFEGIMVKCGDTQVKGNIVSRCPHHSISVVTGEGSVVQENRIIDCGLGIRVAGKGHTVSNNCIIRSGAESILVMDKNGQDGTATQNIIVENNTCAVWSRNNTVHSCAGIGIDPESSLILERNLFFRSGEPYQFTKPGKRNSRHLIVDNAWVGNGASWEGVVESRVEFAGVESDDYAVDSGYGASGWMCRPFPFDPDAPAPEEMAAQESIETDLKDNLQTAPDDALDEENILQKSLFFEQQEKARSTSHRRADDHCGCGNAHE